MDYVAFHQNLLGLDPEKTPAEYRITSAQRRLYESARHGYLLSSDDDSRESWEHFVGTFILAFAQTPKGPVAFAVSSATQKWANEQVKKVARHIFASRKGASEGIQQIYKHFQALSIGSNILQISKPERWVAYGFHDRDVLPPWMRGQLLTTGPT